MHPDKICVLARAAVIDQDHILLCKTCNIGPEFYFLPGGHIEHGEGAESAVLRELMEETGFECSIKRFLGCLEHSFMPDANNPHICHSHEYNLIFQAECNGLGLHTPLPKLEEFIEILWYPVIKLEEIDLRPAPLKQLITSWLESPDQAYMFYSWLTRV